MRDRERCPPATSVPGRSLPALDGSLKTRRQVPESLLLPANFDQQEPLMSASATPKQGDHVFNALESAIMRPFETIRSLRSTLVDSQHFLYDYLLQTYSMAKMMADQPDLLSGRKLVASPGEGDDAVKVLTTLRSRYPALARIDSGNLRNVHQ